MGVIIDGIPKVQEIDAALAEVSESEAKITAAAVAERERYQAELDKHHATVEKALASGEPPPSAKPEPRMTSQDHAFAMQSLQARRTQLLEQRQHAIADALPQVEEQAREDVSAAVEEARGHVEALADISTRVRDAQVAVVEAWTAVSSRDAADPQRGRFPVGAPAAADPHALVNAVTNGVDLLHVQVPRRIGMVVSNLHEMPTTAWEPPFPA
jgi:hypothetical protein